MSKPTIRERAAERICPECGATVERRSPFGRFPTFCGQECKDARHNRRLARGYTVIEFLCAWRIDRGTGEIAKGSLAQLCQIADEFNAQDLEAGRPRIDLMAAKLLATQTTYFDRRAAR